MRGEAERWHRRVLELCVGFCVCVTFYGPRESKRVKRLGVDNSLSLLILDHLDIHLRISTAISWCLVMTLE